MKVAIFHNYLDNIGGAERVNLILVRELGAEIYSTVADHDMIEKMGFGARVRALGWLPVNAPYRQQMALWKFRRLNLSRHYDHFIIGGDWAVSAAVNNKPNLWYCHSPIRDLWDLYPHIRADIARWYLRYVFDTWVRFNRHLNLKYLKHVDKMACNSENTRSRVKKYLKRDAVVIYPPVETESFRCGKPGDYWLSVNRLVSHKRIEIQMKAFRSMPGEKLIIVGSYEKAAQKYRKYIEKIKPGNVTLLNWVDEERLIDLYANCKGLIATAKDEDFGLTPVEAMASGKPVICGNEGGYRETVIDGLTGVLIDGINEDKIMRAVREVGGKPGSYRKECLKRAREFDTKIFVRKIKEMLR
jgi:glycosyltransferase involved in cell wall biosynthesis